jgi:16S rRNA G966 N2-methylase RsmD
LNNALLSRAVQKFILENESQDINKLLLKYRVIDGVPMTQVADQIRGRNKAKSKFPYLYNTSNIFYPPSLHLEQSSSEDTARFKTDHVLRGVLDRDSCVDLTSGFGVDSFFFSKVFRKVYAVEPDSKLAEMVKHNYQLLASPNIESITDTAENFLQHNQKKFSLIFIDPSRRDDHHRKVVAFADCKPDITQLQESIFKATQYLLVKASPLMDIQIALSQLRYVKRVFIVSVDNECKELLFLCESGFNDEPVIEAVNLVDQIINPFVFTFSGEGNEQSVYEDPLQFIYEPNASILKAGAFKSAASRFELFKIGVSTHLYTSAELKSGFPGRVFRVIAQVPLRTKVLASYFPEGKANINVRNFPMSVQELRKTTGLKDGGDRFLLAFSGMKKKFVVAAERVR